ncbi:MAG: AraC family transcriptional regulator [Spartobacteria bacterium]|nr:AraC family transcriptional regulator [Spartobacteria bacterium]
MKARHPFETPEGGGGVVVYLSEQRWRLTEWHSHERLEMNLVLRGSGSLLLENRRYRLLPGHLVWLWPGERHTPFNWSSDMLMWIIEWEPPYSRKLLKHARRHPLQPGQPDVFFCRKLDEKALHRMQGALEAVAAEDCPDTYNLGLEYLLYALWDAFIKAPAMKQETFLHPGLQKVLSRLHDTQGECTLDDLARSAGLSPNHLSTLFKRQTGMSIPTFRNHQRLQAFLDIHRKQPETDMLNLALDAGFGSYAQFYRVFTRLVGQNPRSWALHVTQQA